MVYNKYWGTGMLEKLVNVSHSHRGSNVLGQLWEEIREVYNNEIQMETCLRCEQCGSRRSDVMWNREEEKDLCSTCALKP